MSLLEIITGYVKRFFILSVRLLERTLTGQSDYRIYTSEIAEFDAVTDKMKAGILKKDVETYLRRQFGIFLKEPVVVDLYSGSDFSFRGIVMELNGNLGCYHYEKMKNTRMVHMIYLLKGLNRKRFQAVLAHEMAHAYCREEGILPTDRFNREGFCRWIEFKVLMEQGMKEEADKIKKIKTWKYGRAVGNMFALEERLGPGGVINYLKKRSGK